MAIQPHILAGGIYHVAICHMAGQRTPARNEASASFGGSPLSPMRSGSLLVLEARRLF